jgi:hypothetical protein
MLGVDVVLPPPEDTSQAAKAVPFHSGDGARLADKLDFVCTQEDNPLPVGW